MLILDNPNTWPKHIVKQLKSKRIISLLKNHNCIDEIKYEFDIMSIFVDVEEYAESAGIAGYHCTKQLPEKPFIKTGLRILNYKQHHQEFLNYIRDNELISKKRLTHIKNILSSSRIIETREPYSDENTLHLIFVKAMIGDYETEQFFKYFGGEAIFKPIIYEPDMKDITNLLEKIGEPVVVEARVNISNLRLIGEYRLGRVLVSYFAQNINPNFHIETIAGYTKKDIPPCDIITVHPLKEFLELLGQRTL